MFRTKRYTEEDFKQAVMVSKSFTGVCRVLGLRTAGGNIHTVKRNIARLNLDHSHFTNSLWSKGERLKDWADYKKPKHLKKNLIKEKGYKCEICNLDSWLNKHLVLELDHIDGNNKNNSFSNIRLLCPNCHSQTPTWRNRKRT